MLVLAPVAMVLVLLSAYRTVIFSCPRYAEGNRYNQARVTLVDYPMKDWEKVEDVFYDIGITQNDYESVQHLMLADTDRIDAEYMETIAEIGRTNRYPITLRGIVNATWYVVKALLGSKGSLYLGLIISVGILSILILKPSRKHSVILLLAVIGTAVIFIYLSCRGRLPGRVLESGLLALGALVLCEILGSSSEPEKEKQKYSRQINSIKWIAVIVVMCGGVLGYIMYPHGMIQNLFSVSQNIDLTEWQDTMEEGKLYLWSSNIYGDQYSQNLWKQGKLINSEFLNHHIPYGDWYYGQPGFQEHVAALRASNPMKALLNRPQTYLVAGQNEMEYVLTYLQEHFDSFVQPVRVSTLFDYPVWQFKVTAE